MLICIVTNPAIIGHSWDYRSRPLTVRNRETEREGEGGVRIMLQFTKWRITKVDFGCLWGELSYSFCGELWVLIEKCYSIAPLAESDLSPSSGQSHGQLPTAELPSLPLTVCVTSRLSKPQMGLVLLFKEFLRIFHAFCFPTASDIAAMRKGKCKIGTAWRQPYKTFRRQEEKARDSWLGIGSGFGCRFSGKSTIMLQLQTRNQQQ